MLNRFLVLVFAGVLISGGFTFAQSDNPVQHFSAFDAASAVKVNHQPLTDFLEQTVLPVGRSYRILGDEKPETYRASRIKTSKSLEPSRYEGGRIFIHAFTEDHDAFFKAYQEGLEALSLRRPLRQLNKNEQAAYWLNLYNVIVINKLAEEYPIRKLKDLRSPKREKPSFWTEKVTTVEGIPLSLSDIEKILFANFDSPLVAFGLWQGSIGGPRLNNFAFTGQNVWRALEESAYEFVNSNRGLRPPEGSSMKVSEFYEWVKPAFGGTDYAVLSFIQNKADPSFVQGVDRVTNLKYKLYNWVIADVMGGTLHDGTKNQMGGVLTGRSRQADTSTPGSQKANTAGSSNGGTMGTTGSRMVMFEWGKSTEFRNLFPGLPESFYSLIKGIAQNNRIPRPVVRSVECGPGEDCEVEEVSNK